MHKTSFVVGARDGPYVKAMHFGLWCLCACGCDVQRFTHAHMHRTEQHNHAWNVAHMNWLAEKRWCKREKQLKFREQFYSISSVGRASQKYSTENRSENCECVAKMQHYRLTCSLHKSFFSLLFSLSSFSIQMYLFFSFCCCRCRWKGKWYKKNQLLEITHHQIEHTHQSVHTQKWIRRRFLHQHNYQCIQA